MTSLDERLSFCLASSVATLQPREEETSSTWHVLEVLEAYPATSVFRVFPDLDRNINLEQYSQTFSIDIVGTRMSAYPRYVVFPRI